VRTPVSLRGEEEQRAFAALFLDVAVVAAYGLILPEPILKGPRRGCLNVHGSLLPRWRGAAPVQRAILAGDEVTGVTIMQMERGLDTGPMLMSREIAVDRKTAGELTREIAREGAVLMREVLGRLDEIRGSAQKDEGATYAAKVEKHEARIDFGRSAGQVDRQIRAFNPAPGAFFDYAGERIKIHFAEIEAAEDEAGSVLDERMAIACGQGSIVPRLVQRSGRGVMTPQELLRGFPIPIGAKLG
jgi:methionyl-tRNA formyltransferase